MTRRLIIGVVLFARYAGSAENAAVSASAACVVEFAEHRLRTDLTLLPEYPPSGIPIVIEQVTCPEFNGFREALAQTSGERTQSTSFGEHECATPACARCTLATQRIVSRFRAVADYRA